MKKISSAILGVILAGFASISIAPAQNQLDLAFNAAPSFNLSTASAKGQIVQPDGKVIVWGRNLNSDTFIKGQIVRLNTDGTVDNTFNYCNCHLPEIGGLALQPDGKMVISYTDTPFSPAAARIGYRLNSDGSLDGSYQTAFSGDIQAMRVITVQTDGKIYYEETYGGQNYRRVGRYNSNGSLDGSFTKIALTGATILSDLRLSPDGKMYVGYRNAQTNLPVLRRFNSDGSQDGTWTDAGYLGGSTNLSTIDLQPDGKVLAGGTFTSVSGHLTTNVVRFLTTGAVDTTFSSSGFTSGGSTVRYLSTGKVLFRATRSGDSTFKIYRLNSDGTQDGTWSRPGTGELSQTKDAYSEEISKIIESQDLSAGASSVYAQNRFVLDSLERAVFLGSQVSDPVNRFYRMETTGDLDPGFNSNSGEFAVVRALGIQSDGKVVMTGAFDLMSGTGRSGIARVNTDGSIDTTFNPGTGIPHANFIPGRVLIQSDGKIIVDNVGMYNGAPTGNLIRINSDGTRDTSYTPSVSSINAAVLQSDGKLLIGGNFTTVNGAAKSRIARLNADGTTDTSFAPVLGQANSGLISVRGMAVQSDGKIIIGGRFGSVNGFAKPDFARLNADGTLDSSFDPGSSGPASLANHVRGVYFQSDGKVLVQYAPGDGDTGNSPKVTLERRNANGSFDPTFRPIIFGRSPNSVELNSVLSRADGNIFVGGAFSVANGVAVRDFIWVDSSGRVNNRFFRRGTASTSMDDRINAMALQTDGKVILGGKFLKFDGTSRPGIARVSATSFITSAPFDFDGDGRSDIGVFRPSDGNWYLAQSTAGFAVHHFGTSGDAIVPSDYDGDSKTDLAVFRDGAWWYLRSSNGTVGLEFAGQAGDIPLRGDFDADGIDDFVVYRPSTVEWKIRLSSYPYGSVSGSDLTYQWGTAGDIPFLQDFDGDGKASMGLYRPSDGRFYYTLDVPQNGIYSFQWGMAGDVPVPADYDGDGRTDFAVWRPSNGAWYVSDAATGAVTILSWGMSGDKPVVGDYDGDGRSDVAIYRPLTGVWYILQSTGGFTGMQYGLNTDEPVPSAYHP